MEPSIDVRESRCWSDGGHCLTIGSMVNELVEQSHEFCRGNVIGGAEEIICCGSNDCCFAAIDNETIGCGNDSCPVVGMACCSSTK